MRKIKILGAILLGLSLVGCSKEKVESPVEISYNLVEIYDSVSQYYSTYMKSVSIDDLNSAIGIEESDIVVSYYEEAFLDVKADVLFMMELKEEDKVASVVEYLEKRKQEICDEFETYIPEQYEIAKKAKVISEGKYVFMFINEDSNALNKLVENQEN